MFTASAYDRLAKGAEKIALVNPVATLLTQMGHAFVDPHAPKLPPAATAAGGYLPVAIAVAIVPAVFVLGWWVFTREAPRVAENL
jgi:ABC-2 type transport system permease protein